MIEPNHPLLSLRRQCDLLGLNRSSWYYEPGHESEENLGLMRLIDEQYTRTPFYGVRRMTAYLSQLDQVGQAVNVKRVRRLMRVMGLEAIYPKPRTTMANSAHKMYPYLLRDLPIERPLQVLSADITYIPMRHGFMYLVAILDWYSRYVVAWRLSNTLDGAFCLEALHEALQQGHPEIFNTDQGVQFTAHEFTGTLEAAGVRVIGLRYAHTYGWSWASSGQCLCRATVAHGQIRGHLSARLCYRARPGSRLACLLPLLQS